MRAIGAAVMAAGAAAVAGAVRKSRTGPAHDDDQPRWLGVTVYAAPADVPTGASLPEPLARFGDGVEVVVRPAPGDKGTELMAKAIGRGVRTGELRAALRDAKSLIETGEVVQPDAHPSTHPGPAGRLLSAVNAHAKEVGRL
ncbi:hypothetical protein [Actinokineospora bangkokensis]|uniref:Uncharacterized protein n=1 Tax=Actinokineospora bangkokensis TaxID=1193682 RepID=A0A1Q9LNB7_9PSEU|nr:hypothetical protein [Actinokineospora bangkokensis]OLR93489.1 hypothetical protein BJP25_14375 [Actinokineospora bangkokensis]